MPIPQFRRLLIAQCRGLSHPGLSSSKSLLNVRHRPLNAEHLVIVVRWQCRKRKLVRPRVLSIAGLSPMLTSFIFLSFSMGFSVRSAEMVSIPTFSNVPEAAAAVQRHLPTSNVTGRARRRSTIAPKPMGQTHTGPGFRRLPRGPPVAVPAATASGLAPLLSAIVVNHQPAVPPTTFVPIRHARTWKQQLLGKLQHQYCRGLLYLARQDAFHVSRRRFGLSPGRSD